MVIKLKNNLKKFESIIKIINNISDETDYLFGPEGIKVRAVAPSNVLLGIFDIKKEFFDKYEITEEKILTIDNVLFSKLIKKVGKKELAIDFLEDAIQLSNSKETFSLKFFVGKKDERPDPQIPCTSIWKLKSSEFATTIKELSELGVICCVKGNEELSISIKSNMIEGESLTTAEKIQSDDAFCYYDIGYITPAIGCKDIFDDIRIGFATEIPLMIKGTTDDLNFVYIVAAREE